jgi:anti-anti-sigma factor
MTDQLATMEVEPSDGSLLVRLRGEIDLSNANQMQRQLENTIEGYPLVVVDLTKIEYLDSQGLRLIKQICDKSDREDIVLKLIAPSTSIARKVLDIARMSDRVEIRDALEG